jgi:pimeloyl-ACP methyl ester carboxylesterase
MTVNDAPATHETIGPYAERTGLRSVEVAGSELVYLDTGVMGDGRTVLALHSLGADHRMLQNQVELLAPYARVIAPDCRGHGSSGWDGTATLPRWCADIEAVLDAAGAGAVDLLSISMGGVQAMAYARLRPQRVGRIVLADTFCRLDEELIPAKVEGTAGAAERLGMERYADYYLSQTLTAGANGSGASDLWRAIAGASLDAYVASARACFGADVTEGLSSVRSPTLVLWGEWDRKTPRTLSEEIAAMLPDSELEVVPQAGHLSNLDNPAAFNGAVARFLELPLALHDGEAAGRDANAAPR